MLDKYNPVHLLLSVAMHFESIGKMVPTVNNEVLTRYAIEIEIKDSAEKFRIMMIRDKIELTRGARISARIKKHEDLEKSRDDLESVTIHAKDKESKKYPNYEDFCRDIAI